MVELLFTSESQQELDSSLKLRPADDVLLTVNFMTDRNGLVHLTEIQVGVVYRDTRMDLIYTITCLLACEHHVIVM